MPLLVPYSVVQEWNKSLGEDVPKRSNLHARSKALFLLWNDASPDRRSDSHALMSLLEQKYRFEVDSFYIPLEDSQRALQERVTQFTNSIDTASSLALIYYSGNGSIKNNSPFWLSDSNPQPRPKLDWSVMQESLETSSSDVVLLFDCGYGRVLSETRQKGGNPSFRCVSKAPIGRLEILAAPSGMSADDASFRKALIRTLAEACGEQVSIARLRRKIYRSLGDAWDPEYVNLSRGSPDASIVILPLERVDLDMIVNKSMDSGNQQGLKEWADRAPRQIKAFKFLPTDGSIGDDDMNHVSAQVDVASLEDLNKEDISSWTKRLPSYVVDIKIQGSVVPKKERTCDEHINDIIQVLNKNARLYTDLTTRDGQYKRIVVLPMKWLHDGFDNVTIISQELCKFGDAFRTNFDNCEVKPIYEIPAGGALLRTVTGVISDILEGLNSSDLFIVVYNGHGSKTDGQIGECVLSGVSGSEINWNAVQPYLDEAACDVAQILDCCYAGNAIKTRPQGRNEILAACERDVPTPCGPDSYMERFTAILLQLIREANPFSLSTVHDRIKTETKRRNIDREQSSIQRRSSDAALNTIPLPVHKLIPEISDSITLRPKILAKDREQDGSSYRVTPQEGNGFIGWGYAKIPICRGDERKQLKDVRFVKILNGKEMLDELQGGI